MPGPDRDEFFVGYLPAMPRGIGRATSRFVAALALFVVGTSVLLVSVMNPPAATDWGVDQENFEGVLIVDPYPALFIGGEGPGSALLVVGTRKFGARDRLLPFDGALVRLRGTVLRRGELAMLELGDETDAVERRGTGSPPFLADLGEVVLRGEVVDSKCYAGAMKPGEGKVHRDCAVLCLKGGIPPALSLHDARASPRVVLLAGPGGGPIGDRVLDHVAEPTEVRGRLKSRGELYFLWADTHGLRRLE